MKQQAVKIPRRLTTGELRTSAIILIVYAVGIAGISIPLTGEFFLRLIPFVIVLSLVLSLVFHRSWDLKTVAVFTSVVIVAWMIEAAGVATGIIFGNYSYGTVLGIKRLETPLLIGFNWLLLIYGTANLTEKIGSGAIVKILTASGLMVVYDLVLEVAAPYLGMWEFDSGTVPVRNFIAWFLLSVVFHSIIRYSGIRVSNPIAAMIVIVQFIFFALLSIIFLFAK